MGKGPRPRKRSVGRYHKNARRSDFGSSGSVSGPVTVRRMTPEEALRFVAMAVEDGAQVVEGVLDDAGPGADV